MGKFARHYLADLIYNNISRISGRVYPGYYPQKAGNEGPVLPAVTYSEISNPRTTSKAGNTGISQPRVQIRCIDKLNSGAWDLAREVEELLSSRRNYNYNGIKISRVRCVNSTEDFDEDLRVWSAILDFILEISNL